jgi:uncharacterized membrane protein YhhN
MLGAMPSFALEIPAAAEQWFTLTLVALGLHLFAEYRKWSAAIAVTKLVASTGFLLTAASAGALELDWGRWLFVGLVLSWVGDACLLGRGKATFLAGLVAFLLGHVSYCVAFFVRGFDSTVALTAVPLLAIAGLLVDRWLRPHVGDDMRLPVRAYIVVISTMLALAIAAWRGGASHLLLLGAVSFYLSDLSVARDRFIEEGFFNRLWGLPAYYLGQLCLALSVLPV